MDPIAIISLVAGILSIPAWFCCYLGAPFGLVSIISGIIALVRIKKEPQRLSGSGLAIGGIAASVVGGLIMVAIFVLYGAAMILSSP